MNPINNLYLYFTILNGSKETLVLNNVFIIVPWDIFYAIKVLQTCSGVILFTDLL